MVGEDGRPDMLNGEQTWKNCGNMGTNRNFGTRDQGRTTLKVECSSGNRLVIGEDLRVLFSTWTLIRGANT